MLQNFLTAYGGRQKAEGRGREKEERIIERTPPKSKIIGGDSCAKKQINFLTSPELIKVSEEVAPSTALQNRA